MQFETLKKIIFSKSSEKRDFTTVTKEWIYIKYDCSQEKCICGHNPIIHCFWFKNINTDEEIHVGSECIKYFGRQDFCNIAKIEKENSKRISKGQEKIYPCKFCDRRTANIIKGEYIHQNCQLWDETKQRYEQNLIESEARSEKINTMLYENVSEWERKFLTSIKGICNLTERQEKG